jgi:catechol 2,3-dioxygenase-like lactoylglutathione lyase family enzyme
MPSPTTNEKRTSVRGLGEIALRVNNLDAMQKFYDEVIGLPLMARVPNCAFFKIADGYGGQSRFLNRIVEDHYRGLTDPRKGRSHDGLPEDALASPSSLLHTQSRSSTTLNCVAGPGSVSVYRGPSTAQSRAP